MKIFLVILAAMGVIAAISVMYVFGIDDMNEQHPEYKANDFP